MTDYRTEGETERCEACGGGDIHTHSCWVRAQQRNTGIPAGYTITRCDRDWAPYWKATAPDGTSARTDNRTEAVSAARHHARAGQWSAGTLHVPNADGVYPALQAPR